MVLESLSRRALRRRDDRLPVQLRRPHRRGWTWSERYATQPEILAYLDYVADLLDLRSGIQLDTRVVRAEFDEAGARWRVTTDRGEQIVARYCVMATGCLSSARIPDIPGRDSFAGPSFHTGRWPHEGVDFTGLDVGIIGTGSSGIQSIPVIARQAEHLTVFQRTPNFSVPAHNRPRDPEDEARMKLTFAANREQARRTVQGVFGSWVANDKSALEVGDDERREEFERRWAHGGFGFLEAFTDMWTSRAANDHAADFVRAKIRGIVEDPEVAELLCPTRSSARNEAAVRRHRLPRHVQPAQRHARRPAGDADRGDHPARRAHVGRRARARPDRLRHRLRRHDRRAARDGHSRPRRPALAEKWSAGPSRISAFRPAASPTCS